MDDLNKVRGKVDDMEGQISEMNERLEDEEDANAEVATSKHKLEDENEDLKKEISDLDTALEKVTR